MRLLTRRMGRRAGALAWLSALVLLAGSANASPRASTASYQVELLSTAPVRVSVRATLPSDGALLAMALSRSADVPQVAEAGWPGLVRNLSVTTPDGRAVGVTSNGAEGWTLQRPIRGELTVRYDVDYAQLAQSGWPAPRETAYADDSHLVVIGRSLFITTAAQQTSKVRFSLPAGWQPALPWPTEPDGATHAVVASTADLTENLLAFVHGTPDVLSAGGFDLKVVAFGPWQPARSEVRQVLGSALRCLVAMIGFTGSADYLVVLLPQLESGGESFRASFALTSDEVPSRANRGRWGNTLTHEVFHYWNGWRLRGADYPSSQWFQEGVTEYVANLALVSSGTIEPEEFFDKLATHVANYRRLTTPLDAPGTHKGPPLYSGGALVAFIWDAAIREHSQGARGLGDVLRVLLEQTSEPARPYAWTDIERALNAIAPQDWAQFQRRFIHAAEPLPLGDTLSRLGLVMSPHGEGQVRIAVNPTAPQAAQRLRRTVIMGGNH